MGGYDGFARYYEADFRDCTDDLPFYHDIAQRAGDPILELMCGAGRVLLPLAQAGFRLTGVDSSPEMLALARQRLEEAGVSACAKLMQGDARTIVLPRSHFAAALVAFNSFAHLETIDDQLAVLANIRQSLKRNGLLAIDLANHHPVRLMAGSGMETSGGAYDLDGHRVEKTVRYTANLSTQISDVVFRYAEHSGAQAPEIHELPLRLRWFTRFEMEHLLARAGFRIRGLYGWYDYRAYTVECPALLLVASRAPKPGA